MTETNPTTNHKTIIKMGSSELMVVFPSPSASQFPISPETIARKMSLPELEIIFEEDAEPESSYGSYEQDYSDSEYSDDEEQEDFLSSEYDDTDQEDEDNDNEFVVSFGGSATTEESILLFQSVQLTIFDILNNNNTGEGDEDTTSQTSEDETHFDDLLDSPLDDSGIDSNLSSTSDISDLFNSGLCLDRLFPRSTPTSPEPPRVVVNPDDQMTSEEIYNASEIASIPASPQVELPLTKEEMDRLREQERQIAEHERQMRAAVVEANHKWNALMAEPKAAATVDAKLNVSFVELL